MLREAGNEGMLAALLRGGPPRAAGFIVTIYGDVVDPRGGRVWIGNLIETCAAVGISETLVRTAVSRLVAAGQLAGERDGRRSHYRLTPAARTEYAEAAAVLFAPAEPAAWHFVHLGDAEAGVAHLERAGFARIGPGMLAGPRSPGPVPGAAFRAEPADPAGLRGFAAAHWDLAAHGAAYDAFLARFAPLAALPETARPAPAEALAARLLLVHHYRGAALHDPRLPAAALPEDWPGAAARRLFARAYLALSPAADAHVARSFVEAGGPLPETTETTRRRLAQLAAEAGD